MSLDLFTFDSMLITAVISTLYNDTLSNSWSFDRYYDFLYFANTVMIVSQNNNTYIIVYSLKIVETYLKKFTVEPIESERVIFLTAFKLSQKYLDDFHYPPWEVDLSLLTELNGTQLKQFEWTFLDTINYEITMTPTDYTEWESNCQNTFINFVVPLTQFQIMKDVDVQQDHGLLSPPSSVISTGYWATSGEDDIFNDICFDG
ncbi:hypothetical protein BDF21DRAFT_497583 [Thamnidium elegans]|nr:hypothetical protein BDF21DRAFT_497583 [Thamnidium elegans]